LPVHLRAYVFVMILGYAALFFVRKQFVPAAISEADFDRRRKLWFLVTSIAFISSNFWIFAVACAIAVLMAGRRESNTMALFVALLFAVPPIVKIIPGFGPVEFLIPLSYERILNYFVLVPAALRLYGERHDRPRGPRLPDLMVGLYIAYICLRSLFGEPLQAAMRSCLYVTLDVGILYYVASRSARTIERFREVVIALIAALAVVALISIFEAFRSWWLYDTLRGPFGESGGGYHVRGDMNLLRAQVSLGHSIILGLAMAIGLMLQLSVGSLVTSGKGRLALVLLFVMGCLMPFSRGPWVGAVAGAIVLVMTGPGRGKRMGYAAIAALVAVVWLSATRFGQNIYNMLPFVGNKAVEGSATYRQQLWDVSVEVWKQNLLFGDLHFIRNPKLEVMRQGEGIIDMVNMYLQIGLPYGVVGVVLFAFCALACWGATSVKPVTDSDEHATLLAFQRGLRASIVTLLVTIATVSSVGLLQALLWIVFGLSVGLSRLQPDLGATKLVLNRSKKRSAIPTRPRTANSHGQPRVF
jgi:hypothetical protein